MRVSATTALLHEAETRIGNLSDVTCATFAGADRPVLLLDVIAFAYDDAAFCAQSCSVTPEFGAPLFAESIVVRSVVRTAVVVLSHLRADRRRTLGSTFTSCKRSASFRQNALPNGFLVGPLCRIR